MYRKQSEPYDEWRSLYIKRERHCSAGQYTKTAQTHTYIPSISCSQQGYDRRQDAFLRRTDAANRGNPFLVLDLSFKIVKGVRAFDLESDGLAGEGLK
jgi:hypothetical protein